MKWTQSIFFAATLLCFFPKMVSQTVFDAVRAGDTILVSKLYYLKGDTLNARNENGFTPLIVAVYRKQEAVVLQLLRLGANVDDNSPEGPAIVAAAYKSDINGCRLLLKHGASVDLANEEGVTALMYASMNNQPDLVNLLLNAGANPNKLSKNGQSALSFAKKYGFTELVKLLSR